MLTSASQPQAPPLGVKLTARIHGWSSSPSACILIMSWGSVPPLCNMLGVRYLPAFKVFLWIPCELFGAWFYVMACLPPYCNHILLSVGLPSRPQHPLSTSEAVRPRRQSVNVICTCVSGRIMSLWDAALLRPVRSKWMHDLYPLN